MKHTPTTVFTTLDAQGIRGAARVHYNFTEPALVEAAVARGEGRLGRGGAFLCATGQFTGRSPKDKFVVRTPATENTIWWDNNAAMSPEHFARLKADKHPAYAIHWLYWHLPASPLTAMRATPPSHLRRMVG